METFPRLAVLAAVCVLSACSQQTDAPPAIAIERGWVRATPGGNDITAAYFDLINEGGADRLISVSSPELDHVELHRSSLSAEGVMRMEPMEALDVPANGRAAFTPGAEHLMLYGAQGLTLGDTLCLSLIFERSGERIACLPVLDDAPLD